MKQTPWSLSEESALDKWACCLYWLSRGSISSGQWWGDEDVREGKLHLWPLRILESNLLLLSWAPCPTPMLWVPSCAALSCCYWALPSWVLQFACSTVGYSPHLLCTYGNQWGYHGGVHVYIMPRGFQFWISATITKAAQKKETGQLKRMDSFAGSLHCNSEERAWHFSLPVAANCTSPTAGVIKSVPRINQTALESLIFSVSMLHFYDWVCFFRDKPGHNCSQFIVSN